MTSKMSPERQGLDEDLAGAGQGPLNDDEWSVFEPLVEYRPYVGPGDFADVAEAVCRHRAAGYRRARAASEAGERKLKAREAFAPAKDSALAGEAWRVFQARLVERIFSAYGDEKRRVRQLFGLAGPLPLTSVEDAGALIELLQELADASPRQGDMLTLESPFGGEIKFWLGYHLPEDVGADHLIHGQDAWEATTCKPLAGLRESARKIASESGCREGEAVAYLLCDALPAAPLLGVQVERASLPYDDTVYAEEFDPAMGRVVRRSSGPYHIRQRRLAHTRYTIAVFSHLVPPEEVAALYREARDQDARRNTYSGLPEGREEKALRPWTLELLRFVSEERQTHPLSGRTIPWSSLHALWNRRYPQKPFTSWQAMLRSYKEASRPREDAWPLPGRLRLVQSWEMETLRRRAAAGEPLEAIARDEGLPLAYLREALEASPEET